jgi:hypothetical protein
LPNTAAGINQSHQIAAPKGLHLPRNRTHVLHVTPVRHTKGDTLKQVSQLLRAVKDASGAGGVVGFPNTLKKDCGLLERERDEAGSTAPSAELRTTSTRELRDSAQSHKPCTAVLAMCPPYQNSLRVRSEPSSHCSLAFLRAFSWVLTRRLASPSVAHTVRAPPRAALMAVSPRPHPNSTTFLPEMRCLLRGEPRAHGTKHGQWHGGTVARMMAEGKLELQGRHCGGEGSLGHCS